MIQDDALELSRVGWSVQTAWGWSEELRSTSISLRAGIALIVLRRKNSCSLRSNLPAALVGCYRLRRIFALRSAPLRVHQSGTDQACGLPSRKRASQSPAENPLHRASVESLLPHPMPKATPGDPWPWETPAPCRRPVRSAPKSIWGQSYEPGPMALSGRPCERCAGLLRGSRAFWSTTI